MFKEEWRRRVAVSLAIVVATVLLIVAPRAAEGHLEPLTPLVLAGAVWAVGLLAMFYGFRRGLYLALLGGFIFVNIRFLSVLPGDEAGLWIYDYVIVLLGYALSSYEAGVAWRLMKPRPTF